MQSDNRAFLDTYTRLTAESILNQLEVSLTDKQLRNILKQNEAFYKKILTPFCEYIVNQQILDYCENLNDFGNSELQNISQAYRAYIKRNELELDAADPILKDISAINDQLNTLKFRHHKYAEQHQQLLTTIKEVVRQHLYQWQELQTDGANQLTTALIADGYSLPENFEQKLAENLMYQAFEVSEIPEKLRKDLKIKKRPPTITEGAVINALTEGN